MSKEQSSNIYCIYKHTSIESGKSYIGQTNNYKARNYHHQNKDRCRAFASAIKKYGWDNFNHEILEENLTLKEANEREVFYIETLNTLAPNGYNLRVGGDNKRFSLETIEKMREVNIGRKHSEDSRKKMSESQKGRKMSEETKQKIGEAHKGRVYSQETKDRISLAAKNKNPMSEETRKKMSESKKGKPVKHKPPSSAKQWNIITPENEHLIIEDLKKFCDENKFFICSAIRNAVCNYNGRYKGYKIYNIDKSNK
jgi:group I intron endonuclease